MTQADGDRGKARCLGVVVMAVALMLGAVAAAPTAVVSPGPPAGADGCPTSWPGAWGIIDRPGPLVPAREVVAVTLCELITGPPVRQGGARRLTGGAAEVVAVLNAMPTRRQLEARLRARERAAGRTLPEDLHLGEACTLVGYGDEVSFAVHYRGGPPAVVLMNRNCGTAHHAGRTRFLDGGPIDAFLRLYRAQVARPPATIAAPTCPTTLTAGQLDISTADRGPADGTGCGDPGRLVQVTDLDTVWVADVTGAVAEVRIRRAPCQAVHRAGRGGLVPKPELLEQLDSWLGS